MEPGHSVCIKLFFTYLAPCKVIWVTANFSVASRVGWHSNRALLQHPPHLCIRIQLGNTNTFGSEVLFKGTGTVTFSGRHPAGIAYFQSLVCGSELPLSRPENEKWTFLNGLTFVQKTA